MKKFISALLMVVMLLSFVISVIPANATDITSSPSDLPLTFKSGLNNLWFTEKKMTALPKTMEATINVPSAQYDIYEGHIFAWYSVANSSNHFIWVDLIRKNESNKDTGGNLGIRILIKNGTTEATKVYYNALNEHVGKKTHIALTVDSGVNLYINGELYTGNSFLTGTDSESKFIEIYNSIDYNKIPSLSLCGDDRLQDTRWTKTSFDNYRYFKGGLYNACIFSDVRTADEIKSDAKSVAASADNLLIAYNTANLTTADKEIPDLSGNGYNMKRTFRGKTFKSGFDNLYSSKKQISALPKTLEATIYVPTSADDQYWGDILAWNNDESGYDSIVWDLRDVPGSGSGKGICTRFLVTSNDSFVSVSFNGSLEAYRGKQVHLALTIDSDIKLYVDGKEWTGTPTYSSGNMQTVIDRYNAINISKLPLPSVGGDFRSKIPKVEGKDWYAVWGVDNYRYFRGKIYSVATFTDVRTADEITEDKNTLPSSDVDNLLMSYDMFDENDSGVICDKSPNGYNIAPPIKWTDAEDKIPVDGYAYSFAVVGDTQVITRDEAVKDNNPYYNEAYKGQIAKIYDWILNNRESKNIRFSFHMGDITDWNNGNEWNLAMENITKMNGKIPYTLARGNHDHGDTMTERYTTDMFESNVISGEEFGFFDGRGIENYRINTLNHYQTVTVGDVMYLMLTLDLGPCKAVIDWANEVIAAHPYHNVIITTHSYLQGDYANENYDGAQHYPYMDGEKDCAANMYNPGGKYNGGNYDNSGTKVYWDFRLQQHKDGGEDYLYQDASYMLDNLVKKHSNISMVLCGHECSEYVKQISSTTDAGTNVLQFLIDGQGVDADLRSETNHAGLVAMFYFSEDGKKVTTEYYSAIRDQYLHDDANTNTYDVNVVEVPEAVKEFYTIMHSLDPANYSGSAWKTISAKLSEVKNIVVTTSDMTEVETAVASLRAVIDEQSENNVDYSNIKIAIAAAEALDSKDYTAESWATLENALAAAKEKLSSDVQEDIDAATAALNSAISGLKRPAQNNTPENDPDKSTKPSETGKSDNTDASDGSAKSKKGCKSAVAPSAITIAALLALALGFKKKKD